MKYQFFSILLAINFSVTANACPALSANYYCAPSWDPYFLRIEQSVDPSGITTYKLDTGDAIQIIYTNNKYSRHSDPSSNRSWIERFYCESESLVSERWDLNQDRSLTNQVRKVIRLNASQSLVESTYFGKNPNPTITALCRRK